MVSNTDDFGELRSLIQAAPSSQVWARLCELLASWPEPQRREAAMPYVQDHLRRIGWAQFDATAPQEWLHQLNRGELDGVLLELPVKVELLGGLDVFQAQHWSRGPWSRLRSLSLRHTAREPAVISALGQASWPALESLDLRACQLDDEAMEALSRWRLPSIKSLEVGFNQFSHRGLEALCSSEWWPQLEELSLGHASLSSHTMQLLVDAGKSATSLKALTISRWPFDWPTARALGDAPWAHRIERLALNACGLGPDELGALFVGVGWAGLVDLELGNNRFGALAMRVLDRLDGFESLDRLSLSYNNLGPEQVTSSALLARARHLSTLDLSRNPLGDVGIERLSGAQEWGALRHLELTGTQLGPAGAWSVARAPWCARLESLALSANGLGAPGISALLKGVTWPALARLELKMTRCEQASFEHLLMSEALPALTHLDLSLNNLSPIEPGSHAGVQIIL